MDGNRDEAERCIEIAVNALREAKLDKAEKFLKKAENLYPTQKAKGELWNIGSEGRRFEAIKCTVLGVRRMR